MFFIYNVLEAQKSILFLLSFTTSKKFDWLGETFIIIIGLE